MLLSNSSALTTREVEIIEQLVLGKSNTEIARQLFLTVHTIEFYATRVYQKLGVRNRTQAALVAMRLGLIKETSPGMEAPTSRETQDASATPTCLTSVADNASRRNLMTAIWAGLGAAVAAFATIGLVAGIAPAIDTLEREMRPVAQRVAPFLVKEAEARHCVAQPYPVTPGQPWPRAEAVPSPTAICYDTFEEAIRSIGADPDDYRRRISDSGR